MSSWVVSHLGLHLSCSPTHPPTQAQTTTAFCDIITRADERLSPLVFLVDLPHDLINHQLLLQEFLVRLLVLLFLLHTRVQGEEFMEANDSRVLMYHYSESCRYYNSVEVLHQQAGFYRVGFYYEMGEG